MTAIACIEDLRKKAEKRVPRMFYDYADSGSWSESTYRANEDDLRAIKFRQRVAIDVSSRDTKMPMLGKHRLVMYVRSTVTLQSSDVPTVMSCLSRSQRRVNIETQQIAVLALQV